MSQGVAPVVDLVMPRLSDSMEDGKILTWLKRSGETVSSGDELAEIETDKATVVYEAEDDGVLEIVAGEGTSATIGTVIARLHPVGSSVEPDADGSGESGPVADVSEPGPAAEAAPERSGLSGSQALIARRMTNSHAEVPDFSLQIEIDMSQAMALRRRLEEETRPDDGDAHPAPTVNDILVKACAQSLREFPLANGSFEDDQFQLHPQVNVGIAVATDDSLVVPTVFDADRRSLPEIAQITRDLAAKVRAGTITPAELSGATFTVSNLGMYGIRSFTAIINQPQAAILAAGAVEERAAVRDGRIEPRPLMSATLACDHRILYGAYAARFLARIREVLEQPAPPLS
jgi:pyruvate dehydrogenase E2 component (dihydrolipoamide acetyltransferase)